MSRRYIFLHDINDPPKNFGHYLVWDGKQVFIAVWNPNVGFYIRKDFAVTKLTNIRKWAIIPTFQ
jgi:hypothetical protein